MKFNLGEAKDLGRRAVKALIGVGAPAITKGILIEMLGQPVIYKDYRGQITTTLVERLVADDVSLWSLVEPGSYEKVKAMIKQYVGDIRWLDADWVIDAIKEDYPALASQMQGWPEAYEWFSRQIDEARQQMET